MKKKAFSILLILCMVMSMIPSIGLTAFAETAPTKNTLEASKPKSGDGWEWDGSTLTLNNFQYVGGDGEEGKVFQIQGDATVKLVGENTFTGETKLTFIDATGSVTIEGDGTLTANNTLKLDTLKYVNELIWAQETLNFSGGTLNLTGGCIGRNGVTISDGTLNIVTPNMVVDGGLPLVVVDAFGSFRHLKISGGDINLTLGTGSTGFHVLPYEYDTDENPNIEMTGGTITSTGGYCLMMVFYDKDITTETPAIKVTDGTIKASGMTYDTVMRSINGGDIIIDGGNYMIDREIGSVDNLADDEVLIKAADYSAVDAAIAKAEALNKAEYKDFSVVEAAIAAVVRGKNITEQAEVDAMAKAIENAIIGLEKQPAGSTDPTKPEAGDKVSSTQTGDDFNFALPIVLMITALIGLCAAVTVRRRRG